MNNEVSGRLASIIYAEEKTDLNKIKLETKGDLKAYTNKDFSDETFLRLCLSLPSTRKLYSDIRNDLAKYSLLKLIKTNSFDNYYYKRKLVLKIRVYYDHLLVLFNVNNKLLDFNDYVGMHEYIGKNFSPCTVYMDIYNDNIDAFKYLFSFICKKYKLVRTKKGISSIVQKNYSKFENDCVLTSQEIIEELGYKEILLEKTNHKLADNLPDTVALNAIVPITGKIYKRTNSYSITVGELSLAFKEKYDINLELLKDMDMAPKEANYLKVVSTGECKHAINVWANEFDIDASKMLLITGGNLYKITEESIKK